MADAELTPDRKRIVARPPQSTNGHRLVQVAETLPGNTPTDVATPLADGPTYEARYWRCRHCGAERLSQTDFTDPCEAEDVPTVLSDGGYSVAEPRTRRALSEAMTIVVADEGPGVYAVEGTSGLRYCVDLTAWTCSCPDFEKRDVTCKHLRRVDLAVLVGNVPGPNGRYTRSKTPATDR